MDSLPDAAQPQLGDSYSELIGVLDYSFGTFEVRVFQALAKMSNNESQTRWALDFACISYIVASVGRDFMAISVLPWIALQCLRVCVRQVVTVLRLHATAADPRASTYHRVRLQKYASNRPRTRSSACSCCSPRCPRSSPEA